MNGEEPRTKYVPKYEKKAQTERWFWHTMRCDLNKRSPNYFQYVEDYLKSLVNPKGGKPIKDMANDYYTNTWLVNCENELQKFINTHPETTREKINLEMQIIWNRNAWRLQAEMEQIIEDAGYGHEGGVSFEIGHD